MCCNFEYPQLTFHNDFEKWSEVNGKELDCIFAETGADREMDFDRESAEMELFENQEKFIKGD